MTDQEVEQLAEAWIGCSLAPKQSPMLEELWWAISTAFDLADDNPEDLWRMIRAVHRRDQSIAIQQVLSAGPLEDLLAKHGDRFIDRVEAEAKSDPRFAKMMGGVWKSSMSNAIWNRVQAVWDRRGWDGIPE